MNKRTIVTGIEIKIKKKKSLNDRYPTGPEKGRRKRGIGNLLYTNK